MTIHRVLITAIGGNIGQGVLKALRAGKRKYYIVGIDLEPLSAGFSLVDSYHQVPRTGSPGFKETLEKIAWKEKLEAIYVCSPTELDFFSLYKEDLEKELGLTIFVNPPNVVRIGSDKLKTANFLCEKGLPYPETVFASDKNGIEHLITTFGFPLIVKPRAGFTSKNVFIVNSREEIMATCTLASDLIVQRYLSDSGSECTAGTVSGADRKVRAAIILRRDINQGTTYRTELIQDENLTKQVIRIVEALGAVGTCNLQFRVVDGTPFVFEINPRFSGTCGIRYLYGFNDSEMVFELLRLEADIQQPELHPAVVLRYWNEVFLPGMTFQMLREGFIQHRGNPMAIQKPILRENGAYKDSSDEEEMKSLDNMADKYFTQKALGPDYKQMEFIMNAVLPYCKGPRVLNLGYGNGQWIHKLLKMGFEVTVVEGASRLVKQCQETFGKSVKVIHSLFEKFEPDEAYQTIIASCVLEHVENSQMLLSLLRSWLQPEGDVHIVVPNALSLHRRVGLKMGMLHDPLQLSPQELEVGHRRAYTMEIFKTELEEAQLRVNFLKGIFLKPLSSGQMIDWPEALLEGYNQLSKELPEYTAFLYGNCSKR